MPNQKVLIERDTEIHTRCRPWIIPVLTYGISDPLVLEIPKSTLEGRLLTDYYQLNIDLNHKFPVKELFPERESRLITQDDFDILIDRVTLDLSSHAHISYPDRLDPSNAEKTSLSRHERIR